MNSVFLEANNVLMPTSFVVPPCISLTGDSVDATKVTSFLAHIWDIGKKLQATKGCIMSDIVTDLAGGDLLYLYLVDEATGTVVVPNENDHVYPNEIPTRDDHSFVLMNLPLIQSNFK
ncbi:Aste57867_7204 [Aphanomyces stellatus]|uniref:Aste57867_7204 protein n=1 Tax=Aphanomyces stellatus TaxID=120398 RepID=A0A485KFM9_9STRA|nr:hypothetical protein As57867_007179 [Aphanomyces stellatus]VFT84130.1 Aste57867_7204 [Aphanomyces stellatus]